MATTSSVAAAALEPRVVHKVHLVRPQALAPHRDVSVVVELAAIALRACLLGEGPLPQRRARANSVQFRNAQRNWLVWPHRSAHLHHGAHGGDPERDAVLLVVLRLLRASTR